MKATPISLGILTSSIIDINFEFILDKRRVKLSSAGSLYSLQLNKNRSIEI